MEPGVALIVILLYLGIFGILVILVLKKWQLDEEVRRMRRLTSALADRIKTMSALSQTLEEEKRALLERNQTLEMANQQLSERNEAFKQALKEKHPGLLEKIEAVEAENQALKEEIQRREQELAQAFKKEKQELVDRNKALQDELSKMTDQLSKSTERLKEARREKEERPVREWLEWLGGLTKLSYEGEIEVEVKFILPLVKYLGYHENDFTLRHTVYVQVGRDKKRGQADWVLWDRSKYPPKARAVIEAKAPSQRLDNETREQTRSYAFALGAPVYALTDGKSLQVFHCRVQGDTCIVDCNVGRLREGWPKIHQEMGVGPGIQGMS